MEQKFVPLMTAPSESGLNALLFSDERGDLLERRRRHGLFNFGVFAYGARFGSLEQVIQPGKLYDFVMFVAALVQGSADGWQIQTRRNLNILFSVQRQHRALYLAQRECRIVLEKISIPRRRQLLDSRVGKRKLSFEPGLSDCIILLV